MAEQAKKKLKITLVRSPIGFNKTQAATVQGMGLRRIRHTVELADTPETRGMFDARFFAAMKDGAFFINIGRGESVVTADLTAALQAGRIGGAGLDVTDPEPLPPAHPLWSMSNVIITPHIATSSDFRSERTFTLVVENVRRYVRGDAVLSVVDLAAGY